MLMAELFLEGWGGGTVQSALTWLAANLADSGRRGAVYHSKWGQGWGGAPVTSSLTVSPIGNFSLPLTEKTTGSFFFPPK